MPPARIGSPKSCGRRHLPPDDVVVNLQGDEPMMPPAVVSEVAAALGARPHVDIATAVAPIASLAEFLDPNCVKALRARDGEALYFSRAPVPWPRDDAADGRPARLRRRVAAHRHLRLPGAQPAAIRRVAADAARANREARAAARAGARHADSPGRVDRAAAGGVDTPEDLERVRRLLARAAAAAPEAAAAEAPAEAPARR